jgi:hypothetical protein
VGDAEPCAALEMLFWPLRLLVAGTKGCRSGCRTNAEPIFGFPDTEALRIGEGDETGCGIIDGIVPPRLFGGVTNAFMGADTTPIAEGRGGVEVDMAGKKKEDLVNVGRGIEDGEGGEVVRDTGGVATGFFDGDAISWIFSCTDCVGRGLPKLKEDAVSSSKSGSKMVIVGINVCLGDVDCLMSKR